MAFLEFCVIAFSMGIFFFVCKCSFGASKSLKQNFTARMDGIYTLSCDRLFLMVENVMVSSDSYMCVNGRKFFKK